EDWGAASAAADQLRPLVLVGNNLLAQGDSQGAAAVFQAIAEAVQENYESVDDESGELAELVRDCLAGLGRCLAAQQDAGPREDILQALFDVYQRDVDAGGYGMSDEVPELILEAASAEERLLVAGWVRAALPHGTGWESNYRGQEYGRFLLALAEGILDDDAYLQICRDAGLEQELIERLLTLGRLDEATTELQSAKDRSLLDLADLFVSQGQAETAERVVAAQATPAGNASALEWLKKRADARNDLPAALELQERLFQERSSLDDYLELRRLAQQLGRWDALRPPLLAALQGSGARRVLIQIHLAEGEIDAALEALRTAPPGVTVDMALEVAQAAEATHPQTALDIYRRRAEWLIATRGRANYTSAARLLQKVRDLYRRLDDAGAWTRYLTDLRERTRSLRALKEELATAGVS
ncbi:MAG TPA: hypothetical protein VIU62_14960, partial [Chloroflexota bacterium]